MDQSVGSLIDWVCNTALYSMHFTDNMSSTMFKCVHDSFTDNHRLKRPIIQFYNRQ